jgi:phage/plasmid-like protein (TIGR03299 family)
MAHAIGEMFYYGDRPWHGLGRRLDRPATLEEALTHGGLDWEVELLPLAVAAEADSFAPQRRAVVRTDRKPGEPGRVIGVVHPAFRPLQNRQGLQLFDALLGRGEPVYHTGGYLSLGEVVWLLARVPGDIVLNGDDVIEPYLLYSNSHDGSRAIDIRLTTVRVVCQNTLSLALAPKARSMALRRGHDGSHRLLAAEAKGFFKFVTKQCDETRELFSRLSQVACDQRAFERFVSQLLPDPARPSTAHSDSRVQRAFETRIASREADRREVASVFAHGIPDMQIEPAGETWWGALNTITAWVDHKQRIKGDRYAHRMFGAGDTLKSAALKMACAVLSPQSTNLELR